MKLHLPKMLAAALIAAFTVTGAFATTTTTTTYSDGTVFNGDIWTWNNAGDGTSVSSASSQYTNYTTEQTYAGNANMSALGGPDAFWKGIQFNSETSYVGNTLRFAGATNSIRLNTDYNAWVWVGGIITEAGNSGTYTLGRNSSDIRLKGNHDVNMIIKSNFTLMSGTDRSTEIMTGGTWDVATDKVLTFSGKSLTQYANQAVKVTGAGTVNFAQGSTVMNAGSSVQIDSGAKLIYANSLAMAADSTITNAGALTLNGTVKLGSAGIANTGSITLGNNIVFDLSQMQAVENKYTLFSGNGLDLSNLTTSNITGITTAGKTFTFGTDGTISFTQSAENVWNTDEGFWNYTDENWSNGKFTKGEVAVFDSDYAGVFVNADVEAGGIRATGAITSISSDYFTPGTLTAGSIQVAAGAQLTTALSIGGVEEFSVGEGGIWTIGANQALGTGATDGQISVGAAVSMDSLTIDEHGSVTVQGTGNLTIGGVTPVAALSKITNKGTLSVGLSGTALIDMAETGSTGTLEVKSGTVDYRSKLGGQTLKLGNGTKLLFGESTGDSTHAYAGNIEIAGNVTVQTYGSSKHPNGTTIGGNVTGDGILTRDSDGNKDLRFTGTVQLGGYTNGNSQSATVFQNATKLGTLLAQTGSKTTFTGATADFGTITMEGNSLVEIASKASVSTTLDLSKVNSSTGTVKVKSGGELSVNATLWGRTASHLLLEENGILNIAGMQIAGTAVQDGFTELGTTQDNKIYGINEANWFIGNAAVTATSGITIGNELRNSSINTGAYAVTLSNAGNTVAGASVAEGGSLTMNNGTLSSAITSAGTVTLTGVTLSDSFEEVPGGEVKYDIADTLNYYMGTSNSYITVVTGDGAANATGTGISWKEKTGLNMANGQVITGAGEADYTKLYIGGNTATSDIAGYEQYGSLQNIVVNGATLTVDQPLDGINIAVTGHGTIAGDVTPTAVGIAKDATAEFTADVTGEGYKFSAAEDGTVTVVNGGETTTTYTGSDRNLTVKADTLAAETVWEEVTIGNKVQVDNVTAADTTTLTLDNVAEEPLELQNLTIGTYAYVQVYKSTDHVSDNEATVVISDTLKAGVMSYLHADLTMLGGSTLDLIGTSGMALTLGSKLTFDTTDGLVNLGEDVIAYLSAMNVGDSVNLFAKDFGTTLDYGADYDGMYYGDLFVRTGALVGDFKVYADGNSFGLTKYYNMPEPTTGTLSLLALAALAARRRRK